jgi:hypothetical protein
VNDLLQRTEIRETPEIGDGSDAEIKPPIVRPLSAFALPDKHPADELLRFRFLSRLGTLLFCGPTGIGKSSLAMQFAILWALGKPCFGITPARLLKSLIIQAENDDGDIAEIREGIYTGLELTAEERERAASSIFLVKEDSRSGLQFITETVKPSLREHPSDLLWIDPMLSYLGGDANSQQDVGRFLRNWLNPTLREFNCGCVATHHSNKPPSGKEKPQWSGGDYAYLGAGSAEWANHARAVLALRSIGSRQVFELQAGKRGGRLGWKDAEGNISFMKYLAHSKKPGVICWREITGDETPAKGRPKSYDIEEMLALLPSDGLAAGEWQQQAKGECGISESSFHRERRALEKAGRILKSKISGKWQPVKNG